MATMKMKKRTTVPDGDHRFQIKDVQIRSSKNDTDYARLAFNLDSGASFSTNVFGYEFSEDNALASAVYDYCKEDEEDTEDEKDIDLDELFNARGQVTTKFDGKHIKVLAIEFDEN